MTAHGNGAFPHTGGHTPVSIKRDAVLSQEREQLLLPAADDRVVLPLVHRRQVEASLPADGHRPLDLGGGVVRQPEPPEPPPAERLVHGPARLLERGQPVRDVQVHHVDRPAPGPGPGQPQVRERPGDARPDLCRRVGAPRLPPEAVLPGRGDLGVDGEAAAAPAAPSLGSDDPGAWGL